jgi:hypothetical protein
MNFNRKFMPNYRISLYPAIAVFLALILLLSSSEGFAHHDMEKDCHHGSEECLICADELARDITTPTLSIGQKPQVSFVFFLTSYTTYRFIPTSEHRFNNSASPPTCLRAPPSSEPRFSLA